jgi:hypothetical protein
MSVVTLSFADDAKDAALRTAEKLCPKLLKCSKKLVNVMFLE